MNKFQVGDIISAKDLHLSYRVDALVLSIIKDKYYKLLWLSAYYYRSDYEIGHIDHQFLLVTDIFKGSFSERERHE